MNVSLVVSAQERHDSIDVVIPMDGVVDSLDVPLTVTLTRKDSLKLAKEERALAKKAKWAAWSPDPKRAMWLAIVLPGAGQIYNRKYWKLPIFYGGFVGCAYAMRWNNQMYNDYSQAYLDIMDNDPSTQSYNQFLHLGTKIDDSNIERYKSLFKQRKDRYRRWRDLSFFCILGVYALSIIDAYVDASLSRFDISNDLSLYVEPGLVGGNGTERHRGRLSTTATGAGGVTNTGVGVNLSLSF